MPIKDKLFFVLIFLVTIPLSGTTQEVDTTLALAPITVNATRYETTDTKSSFSLTQVSKNFIQRGQAQLAANESLNTVPGLFALNPNNFAQDLRISIRGFGARAAFGIRGVKVLVDGIPESTPDGQAQVDNLALGIVENIEVIRGPSSSLYGNASGGVVSFQTEKPSTEGFVEGRFLRGSYGLQQYQLKTARQKGKFSYLLHGVHVKTDGYRENSGMKNTVLNGKFGFHFNEKDKLSLLINYGNSPQADDPGGINLEQVQQNRRSARDRNLLFKGGESVEQFRLGAIYDKQLTEKGQLQFKAYHTARDFTNRLPFEFGGIVAFDRQFSGGGISYILDDQASDKPFVLRAGIELENQADNRQRFKNLEGVQGDKTLDQKESFLNFSAHYFQEYRLFKKFKSIIGGRYDYIRIKADDFFLSNGDASGQSSYNKYNSTIGFSYDISDHSFLYLNWSTSFETPTLNELSNNPLGSGGFNTDLKPQEAESIEVGFKGIANRKLRYELVLFNIDVSDEILPFELEEFPGRDFFENAGSTNRIGAELSLTYNITKGVTAYLTHTYSNFSFKEFNDFDDNILPGIPKHSTFTALSYLHPAGIFFNANARFISSIYTNNANSVQDNSYAVVNFNMGYKRTWEDGVQIEPFLGVNNLLDKAYNDNIRINAFGGRFYEPAPSLNLYGGVTVRF